MFMKKSLLAVLLTALLACSGGEGGRPVNVMVIGLDTVRADHLGCYGYHRDTSPEIDRLAAEGTLFEYAVSHSPWTLPSFATVFTSLYPTQHRAGFVRSSMGRGFPTLGTILSDNGYSTGAIINTAALNPVFGIDRGFEYYDVVPISAGRVADGTTRAALEWIDAQGENPFFVFVHYYDPHLPFSPPAPYDTLFDPDYSGPLGSSFDPDFLPTDRMHGFEKMMALPERDKQHIVALYDGEIAFADRAIGDLLDGLQARGLRENTLVVFMSDHGEEFFDHGGFAHGHTLYEELLRVPLIFSLPGRIPARSRVPNMVRLVDIMPTVLALTGTETDARMEGRDLNALFRGEPAAGPPQAGALLVDEAFSEGMLYGPEQKSITAYPYKLIRKMASGVEILFDLYRDPGETENLAAATRGEAPGDLHDMDRLLYGTLFRASDTWYVQVDPGGAGHMLDISIAAGSPAGQSEITLYKAFDSAGRLLEDRQIGLSREAGSSLRLVGLSLEDEFILALKVDPPRTAVEFNILMDGEEADGMTYVGESMSSPDNMPFEVRGGRAGRGALGKPASHPAAPCFLVWHSGRDYHGGEAAKLDRDVAEELRSLGYIQ
jgi:arylsulfatase A-like enzyme